VSGLSELEAKFWSPKNLFVIPVELKMSNWEILNSDWQTIRTFCGKLTCCKGVLTTSSRTLRLPHIFCRLEVIRRLRIKLELKIPANEDETGLITAYTCNA
jgi:hypothetical protein